MQKGREAHIIIDRSVTASCPLIELEALAGKAVALLACRPESVSATIFRKPKGDSYWVSTMDTHRKIRSLVQLKRCAPVVDFEIVSRAVSDIVSTGP